MQDWFYLHNELGLCLTFKALTDCGVAYKTLEMASSRGSTAWLIIDHPEHGKKKLITWKKLRDTYKEKIHSQLRKINKCRHDDSEQCDCGDPEKYVMLEPLRKQVTKDFKAEEYFLSYKFEGEKTLPVEHVAKYTKAASWLNMLVKLNADKKFIKKQLNLSIESFFTNVCEIIKADNIDLPATYQRLRNQMADYQQKGYECLIDWRFGNKLAAKVNDELSTSMLLELIANSNQHDNEIIVRAYNPWAIENGYKPITAGAVGVIHRNNAYQLDGFRKGGASWYDNYGKIIHRKRPSAPLLLVGSDDNDLDLYFTEEKLNAKGHNATNYYYRYKLIVVMDAYNDYILGYAYGENVTADLVRAAYLDAVYHIKELTSGWYLPHQIQTDRWGKGTLDSFYSAIATYTPATAKLARAKYIESAFGTRWHQSLRLYPNYAGTNITSQTRLNADALEANKKNFPTCNQAHAQITDHITRMRNLVNDKTGKTRQQEWQQLFAASELSSEKQISDKRMLMLFGTPHTHQNTITNGGLEVTLQGQTHIYDIPDELYLQNVGKKVQVIFDQFDKSRVLVTDNKNLHFVAREYDKMSSAIADYAVGERARLNHLWQQKKDHVSAIAGNRNQRREVLERHHMDPESLLQAGVMVKEIKQAAELQYQQTNYSPKKYDPLDQM